jgi:dienelactone hydrolase
MRHAPSRIEYSEWTCRWTKGASGTGERFYEASRTAPTRGFLDTIVYSWLVFRGCVAIVFVLLVAGCGGGSSDGEPKSSAPPPHPLFDYDAAAPLGYRDQGRVNKDYPIQVRDVSYASPGGGRVRAFLVVPPGKGPFPGVIYLHGSGEDRTRLVVPAAWLAARGAVALVVDSDFVRSGGSGAGDPLKQLAEDRDLTAKTLVDLRRGVDVLRSLPQVDGERIGFVGYSAGAKVGAILAGLEHRIKAYDLMSGGSPTVRAFAAPAPASVRPLVRGILSQIDPFRFVRRAAPASLFFQDGLDDEFVPRAQLAALARAGSQPKRIRWYRAGHALNAKAYRDQIAWLSRELGVHGPVVAGAQTGPR